MRKEKKLIFETFEFGKWQITKNIAMNNISEIIKSNKISEMNIIIEIHGNCANKACMYYNGNICVSKNIGFCKRCGNFVCADCSTLDREKCVICEQNNRASMVRICLNDRNNKKCVNIAQYFMCKICGKLLKCCHYNDELNNAGYNFRTGFTCNNCIISH